MKAPPPSLRIALLGFGNVGRAFAEYLIKTALSDAPSPVVSAVADASGGVFLDPETLSILLSHKRAGRSVRSFPGPVTFFEDHSAFIEALKDFGVTAIVESLPTNIETGQPALALIETALRRGIDVVTVDKGPMAHAFARLQEAAGLGEAQIAFSGTTGVAIPDRLRDQQVIEIRGVLNGTTNYILTAMQESGAPFDEALSRARSDGIAEPDPRLDIEGWDTACKILILAKALMNASATLSDVSRIGIGPETESLIRTGRDSRRIVRLVGRARIWKGRVRVSVGPKLVGDKSPFYSVSGTSKTAVFTTATQDEVVAHAHSGRDAISRIILDDVLRVSRRREGLI